MEPFCGGSIISTDIVVTAAHCLYNFKLDKWLPGETIYVLKSDNFAGSNWVKESKWFSCTKYVYHESYKPNKMDGLGPFDIAVLKLDREIGTGQRPS